VGPRGYLARRGQGKVWLWLHLDLLKTSFETKSAIVYKQVQTQKLELESSDLSWALENS
jgi:hypothetical protein